MKSKNPVNMEVPSSVYVPAGAVRSKLRQEQRLFDVHCERLLKELGEKKRSIEQFKRRVKLEMGTLEDVKDGPGYQYTGYFPPEGSDGAPSYDIRVTRPRNRIPLRKVCTYRMDSIRDADTATPVVITARRTLSRLRNTASVLHRRNQVRLKARSLSAPGDVGAPEVPTPSSIEERKSVATVNGQVGEGMTPACEENSSSEQQVEKSRSVSMEGKADLRTIRKVVKHIGEIDVDINAILKTKEHLTNATKVVHSMDRSMKNAPKTQAAFAEQASSVLVPPPAHAPQKKSPQRKIRIIAKERSFTRDKKPINIMKPKLVKTLTPRRKTPCTDRQPTPLPYKRYSESANLVSHDMEDVITDVSMRGRQSELGRASVPKCVDDHDGNKTESDVAIKMKANNSSLGMKLNGEKTGSYQEKINNKLDGQEDGSNDIDIGDSKGEEGETNETEHRVTWVDQETESEGYKTERTDPQSESHESQSSHTRAKSGERKQSRVSFNEDVVVANYFNDADDEEEEDELLFWTSEDDARLDEELMGLHSPPSDMESEEETPDMPTLTKLHIMYGGTQKLKSHEGELHTTGSRRNDLTSEQLRGLVGRKTTHAAPLTSSKEKHSAPNLRQSGTLAKKEPRRRRQGAPAPASLKATLKINGVAASRKESSDDGQTVTRQMKHLEHEMHQALSNLEISGVEKERTFSILPSSAQTQRAPLVPLQATRGRHVVLGGVITRVRRPSATEARQRARRPSAQLLQMIERKQAGMSTADRLQVARQRQGPQ